MTPKEALRALYLEMCANEGVIPDTEQADYLWVESVHDLNTTKIVDTWKVLNDGI